MQAEIEALTLAEKMISTKLAGEPAAAEKPAADNSAMLEMLEKRRRRLIEYLAANGRKTKIKLAEATGFALTGQGCISQLVNDPRFRVEDDNDTVNLINTPPRKT